MSIWIAHQNGNQETWNNWLRDAEAYLGNFPVKNIWFKEKCSFVEFISEKNAKVGTGPTNTPIILDGVIELNGLNYSMNSDNAHKHCLYNKTLDLNNNFSSLNGEYSIIIYDEKNQSIKLINDVYSTRPMYFVFFNFGWYFSNDIRLLLLLKRFH